MNLQYYLRNNNMPNAAILVIIFDSMGMAVPVGVLGLHTAVTSVVSMRMAVSMVRRVRTHTHYVHSSTFFFPKHFPVQVLHLHNGNNPRFRIGLQRPDPRLLIAGPIQPLFPLVVLGSDKVNHQC